jgi:hypothetical protein
VEKERNYLVDIIFHSFIRMPKSTLQWLENGFEEISEDILTKKEKIFCYSKISLSKSY